jgi:hypothetical protein
MAYKAAIIKGGKVVSTTVTGTWIEVTVRIPTKSLAPRLGKRLSKAAKAKVAKAVS